MKYKTLETMRQTRLMITEVIVPAGLLVIGAVKAVETIDPGRTKRTYEKCKTKVNNVKNGIVNKFKK